MAILNNRTVNSLARDLASRLQVRLPTLTVTSSVDATDQNPTITINDGTPVAGEAANYLIKLVPFANGAPPLDFLGNQLAPYGHTIVQVVTEAAVTPNFQNDLHVVGEVVRLNAIMERYQAPNGNVPALSHIIAANKVADFRDLYWNHQNAA